MHGIGLTQTLFLDVLQKSGLKNSVNSNIEATKKETLTIAIPTAEKATEAVTTL